MHQLPGAGRHLPQQCPVVDPHRHVRHPDIGVGQRWQAFEPPPQIIAKEPEGTADKGQLVLLLHQLSQQILLGLGEQAEGIAIMLLGLVTLAQTGAGTAGFQGGEGIGAEDVEAVVGALGTG
ncbi:hypothetical protein D3C78_1208050 [compost metagenome]